MTHGPWPMAMVIIRIANEKTTFLNKILCTLTTPKKKKIRVSIYKYVSIQ